MKKVRIEMKWKELSVDELPELEACMMDEALIAARKAYAPYSGFQVGVALYLEGEGVITGNNQENVAYPSGLCAERVALFQAGAQYPNNPVAIMVVVAIVNGEIQPEVSPCGSCRQVLLEMEKRGGIPIEIFLCGREKVRVVSSAADLLPLAFSMD